MEDFDVTTVAAVRECAAYVIQSYRRDTEEGHGNEDGLMEAVIRDIAAGGRDPAGKANELLALLDDAHEKWYA